MTGVHFDASSEVEHVLEPVLALLGSLDDRSFTRLPGNELLTAVQLIERVHRLVFKAQVLLADEVSAQQLHKDRGAPSAAALLRNALQISHREAGDRIRVASKVCTQLGLTGQEIPAQLPVLSAAITTGEIGVEQAGIVVKGMSAIPVAVGPDLTAQAEVEMVKHGADVDPRQLDKIVAHIHAALDPDGTLDPERDPAGKVEFSFGARDHRTGLTPFKGKLDDHGVEVVTQALDALGRPRPAQDGTKDERRHPCRQGHALVEALSTYLSADLATGRHHIPAQVTVLINQDDLVPAFQAATADDGVVGAIYSTGLPVSPAEMRRILCDAAVTPAVMSGQGEVLDLGSARRTFSGAQRKALVARDKGCCFPGCDRPAAWCDSHHIQWFSRGGPTSVANGCLLCPYHHSLIHQGNWVARATPNGPEFIPPSWVDADQSPRRNTLHHIATDLRRQRRRT